MIQLQLLTLKRTIRKTPLEKIFNYLLLIILLIIISIIYRHQSAFFKKKCFLIHHVPPARAQTKNPTNIGNKKLRFIANN